MSVIGGGLENNTLMTLSYRNWQGFGQLQDTDFPTVKYGDMRTQPKYFISQLLEWSTKSVVWVSGNKSDN